MSRIYDSSALTQRRRDLAQAGSFINRIQNQNNPQTSYGPLQGNYDASIMNSVKMGQPKEFYRNSGCVIISNGCPCPPIAVNEIIAGPAPPVILAPGPVTNIQVEYGSVIVTWDAPITGGIPTSYTVSAIPSSGSTVTVTDILTTTYSFATLSLVSGVEYQISVIGVNAAGDGLPPTTLPPLISAPYGTPTITSVSQNSQFNELVIAVNFLTRSAFNLTSGTTFNIFAYINGILQSTPAYTSTILSTTSAQITVSGLTQNAYTFAIQIVNAADNNYSSISSQSTSVAPTAPPAAPTSIQLGLSSYNSQIISFSSSNTVTGALISGGTYSYTNLQPGLFSQTYTLTITGLTQGTPYSELTLQVDTPNGISSAATIPTFTTTLLVITGAAQSLPSLTSNNEYNSPIQILYNPVGSSFAEFIPSVGTLYVPGQGNWNGTPFPDGNSIDFTLPILGIYDNCYIILSNNEGISTQPSNTFTIQIGTPLPPSDIQITSSSPTAQPIAFAPYSIPLTGATISGGYGYISLTSSGLVITGLLSNTTYIGLTITVQNPNGESTTSIIPPFTTLPDAPTNIELGITTNRTQPITFTPYSQSLTGALISDISGVIYSNINLTLSGLTIIGLTPNTPYNGLTVQVQNAGGLSNTSIIPNFITPA